MILLILQILYCFFTFCRTLLVPDESSTPLVRSSERLAAKRRGLHHESLETLYFTPISNRYITKKCDNFGISKNSFTDGGFSVHK